MTAVTETLEMTEAEVAALPWEDVVSSNVRRLAYVQLRRIHGDLYVDFGTATSPSVYRYTGVPHARYAGVRTAHSVGGMINKAVKGKFPTQRVQITDPVAVDDIASRLDGVVQRRFDSIDARLANLQNGVSALLRIVSDNHTRRQEDGDEPDDNHD